MGLGICVGMLADLIERDEKGAQWLRKSMEAVNRCLQAEGAPQHSEPEKLDALTNRAQIRGFPYSFIHYLRYAYAYRVADANWIASPLPDQVSPTKDDTVESETEQFISHLLCHSDAEGFYVPVDFHDLIMGDDLPGGFLGSSYRLLDELRVVAPALDITLEEDGQLSDEEAKRLNEVAADNSGLYRECCTWLALYEAARLSLKHSTAIVFC